LFSHERYFDGDIVLTDLPLMKSVDRIIDDEIICVYSVNNIEAPENFILLCDDYTPAILDRGKTILGTPINAKFFIEYDIM